MTEITSLRKKYVNSSLINKTCTKCNKTYPRTEEFFYKQKHGTEANNFEYRSACIACQNKIGLEWNQKNKLRTVKKRIQYLNTEMGYFRDLWVTIKKSKHGNEFKDFDEFFNCWKEQQKIYGNKCPYTGIEMTRIRGTNEHGIKRKVTKSNISKDRILSSKGYSKENIMFISCSANNIKGSVNTKIAKQYLQFVKERFGTDEIE